MIYFYYGCNYNFIQNHMETFKCVWHFKKVILRIEDSLTEDIGIFGLEKQRFD